MCAFRFTEAARLQLKELVHNSNGKAVALAKAKSPLNFKVSFMEKDEILVKTFGNLCTNATGCVGKFHIDNYYRQRLV